MEGGGRYENGAKAILHAKPSDGFRFLSWIGAPALDVSNLATILVNSDLNLTARFVRTFELAIRVLPSGSGIAQGSDVYTEGEIAAIGASEMSMQIRVRMMSDLSDLLVEAVFRRE